MARPYDWSLKDYPAKNGLKVFSTFSCGGGSTMGYKLAGCDVLAANDIDPDMQRVYLANHSPKHYLLAPIKHLLTQELPEDLYGIDILDGSPPCSVFSTAGLREEAWGKEKMFREGQAKQVLDDLFFDFIALAERLKPKVIVAENVKGMLLGNAKWYTREINRRLNEIGYTGSIHLLNAATMGVPQKRERVFFVYARDDLAVQPLQLVFNGLPIPYGEVRQESGTQIKNTTPYEHGNWKQSQPGQPVGKFFSTKRMSDYKVANTIRASGEIHYDSQQPRRLYKEEVVKIGSFPRDYDFMNLKPEYLIGMSVPPLMIAGIADAIVAQWGEKLLTGDEEGWQDGTRATAKEEARAA